MQGPTKHLSLLILIAAVTLAGPIVTSRQQATPLVTITAFMLPDCVDAELTGTSGSTDGSPPPTKPSFAQNLELNECVLTTRKFESFRARTNGVSCPNNGVYHVVGYYTTDCTGQGVDGGDIQAFVANRCVAVTPFGPANAIGQSIRFTCETA